MNTQPNKAQCKNCKTILESKHRHDWVCCECFRLDNDRGFFLDGGKEYTRMGGNIDDIIWLKED